MPLIIDLSRKRNEGFCILSLKVDSRPRRKHASIEELKEEGDIDELTVRQLKEILATNYVDYKGCVEKWELVSRVKRLWEENAAKRQSSKYNKL